MPHQVDKWGDPKDPKLRRLEDELSDLAAWFRGTRDDSEKRAEIVREYLATLEKLYSLGWDGSLDFPDELPRRLMPERYNERNPPYDPFAPHDHEAIVRLAPSIESETDNQTSGSIFVRLWETLKANLRLK